MTWYSETLRFAECQLLNTDLHHNYHYLCHHTGLQNHASFHQLLYSGLRRTETRGFVKNYILTSDSTVCKKLSITGLLFWAIKQWVVVILADVSGQHIGLVFKGPFGFLTFEDGTQRLSRNVGTTLCVTVQKNAVSIYFATEAWNQALIDITPKSTVSTAAGIRSW